MKNAIQVLLFSLELWQEATFAWLGLLASLSCSIMILGGSVDQRAFILKAPVLLKLDVSRNWDIYSIGTSGMRRHI